MVNARKSHGNAYSVFLSLEGWWILAGDNIPGNHPAALRPGGSPESTIGSTIGPTSPIGPIPPHPKSTLTHPKSIVDLGCELLIRVENGLRSIPLRTGHRPISTPKIKEFSQNQTVTDQKNLSRVTAIVTFRRVTLSNDLPQKPCIPFALIREIRVKNAVSRWQKKKSLFCSFPWSIRSRLVQASPT
jgi:hypothetical protein